MDETTHEDKVERVEYRRQYQQRLRVSPLVADVADELRDPDEDPEEDEAGAAHEAVPDERDEREEEAEALAAEPAVADAVGRHQAEEEGRVENHEHDGDGLAGGAPRVGIAKLVPEAEGPEEGQVQRQGEVEQFGHGEQGVKSHARQQKRGPTRFCARWESGVSQVAVRHFPGVAKMFQVRFKKRPKKKGKERKEQIPRIDNFSNNRKMQFKGNCML